MLSVVIHTFIINHSCCCCNQCLAQKVRIASNTHVLCEKHPHDAKSPKLCGIQQRSPTCLIGRSLPPGFPHLGLKHLEWVRELKKVWSLSSSSIVGHFKYINTGDAPILEHYAKRHVLFNIGTD